MAKKKVGGLGRGLDILFGSEETAEASVNEISAPMKSESKENPGKVSIYLIDPNPHQPRKNFPEEELTELCDSIRIHGVLQPVVVTPRGDRFMLVAGERRWRAARMAELEEIPAVIVDLDDREAAEIALIENLQREDLNPLEEAEGISLLMKDFRLTQEETAARIGKSRSAVANTLRLMKLPDTVRQLIREGKLSAGQGRTLLALDDPRQMHQMALECIRGEWSVRQLEEAVCKAKEAPVQRRRKSADPELVRWADSLQQTFGTKVTLKGDLEKGVLQVHYYQREDLDRIYELLSGLTGK